MPQGSELDISKVDFGVATKLTPNDELLTYLCEAALCPKPASHLIHRKVVIDRKRCVVRKARIFVNAGRARARCNAGCRELVV